MIQAEQFQDGGVQVVDVDALFDGPEAELVRRADDLDAAARQVVKPYPFPCERGGRVHVGLRRHHEQVRVTPLGPG